MFKTSKGTILSVKICNLAEVTQSGWGGAKLALFSNVSNFKFWDKHGKE